MNIRKHNRRLRDNKILLAILMLFVVLLGLILITQIYPQRHVGIRAWIGHCVAVVIYFLCFIFFVRICFDCKLRERVLKVIKEEPKYAPKIILLLTILGFYMFCFVMGYMMLKRSIPLVKDVYSGPVYHQIKEVNVQDIKKRLSISGRRVMVDFKKISLKTKDGDFIQIDLSVDEWRNYSSELKEGEDFIYYPNLKIWKP